MVGKRSLTCAKCGVTSTEDSSLTFHRFPLPSVHGSLKARVWAKYCYPNDDWTSDQSLFMLYNQYKTLCGKHFDASSFTCSERRRLNKFAIPFEARNILAQVREELQNHPLDAQETQVEITRMILLTGNGLNERHRDFNNKVNEAALQGVSFDDVKVQAEKSDVDRLFKIKLADKYKNVEYIIETLKCGDSLYISKALKCAWLFDEEFLHIINPDYLEKEIFSEMSFKMRKKFLTVISMHVTNDRAASFYTYCMQINLHNIAIKFLLKTSEAFKVDVIKDKNKPYLTDENLIAVVGDSFMLADVVFETLDIQSFIKYVRSLSHLYCLSNEKYLDLIEKNILKRKLVWCGSQRLGLRISKHVIKHHKDRILRHISLYINMLNKSMLIKCSSPDDVKDYIARLIPSTSARFWDEKFYTEFEYLLEVIPLSERYQYIKHIFNTNYPGEEFEMDINFYYNDIHRIMTKEEREVWALKHVEAETEHFGFGKNFLWYKFVAFDKTFVAIKKYILTASDSELRNEIVSILIYSAQTDRDLEQLFNYYYQRHVNEMTRYKENFVDTVLDNHKYFEFDDDCWSAFDKILHSMDVYDNQNAYCCKMEYKYIAIIYAIIHKKELHSALEEFIDQGLYMYAFKQQTDKLPEDKAELVYQYLSSFYLKKIENFDIDKYDEGIKDAVKKYINDILHLMWQYNKPRKDIPDIVMKYVHLDFDEYKNQFLIAEERESFTQDTLLKALKNDASLFTSEITRVRTMVKETAFRHNKVLRKLRTYFSMDLALMYMNLYRELLEAKDLYENTCNIAIFGIFQVADIAEKIEFVKKYIPTESKIDHSVIDRNLLYIRKAICKYVGLSRPVVPLAHVQKYMVGDYLKFCLPTIQSYAANLPPRLTTELLEFLLKSPASIQKHGIRLAFECFGAIDVKKIMDLWNSTKNVSLRVILYQSVKNKMVDVNDEQLQKELFEAFKFFTLKACENDDDKFFDTLLATNLPNHILGEHILNAWQVMNTMPDKPKFIKYKSKLIENMANDLQLMRQDLIESIVTDHVTSMLIKEEIRSHYDCHIYDFITAKWNLTAKYIAYLPDKNVIERKLEILLTIVKRCINLWDRTGDDIYFIRKIFSEFFDNINSSMSATDMENCLNGISLLEPVVKELQEALPLIEIYKTLWSLRVSIILRKVLVEKYRMIAQMDKVVDDKKIIKDCVDCFASEFIKLLNESIKQGDYYITATDSIKEVLTNFTSCLFIELPTVDDKILDDVLVDICIKLVEEGKFETHYLALDLLPPNYCYYQENFYKKLISKVKSLNNKEINYFLYRKQVLDSGYDYRKIQGE